MSTVQLKKMLFRFCNPDSDRLFGLLWKGEKNSRKPSHKSIENEKGNLPEWIQVWPSRQWVFLCLKYQRTVSFRTAVIIEVALKRPFCALWMQKGFSTVHFLSCWRPRRFVCLLAGSENTLRVLLFSWEKNLQYSEGAFLRHQAQVWT